MTISGENLGENKPLDLPIVAVNPTYSAVSIQGLVRSQLGEQGLAVLPPQGMLVNLRGEVVATVNQEAGRLHIDGTL